MALNSLQEGWASALIVVLIAIVLIMVGYLFGSWRTRSRGATTKKREFATERAELNGYRRTHDKTDQDVRAREKAVAGREHNVSVREQAADTNEEELRVWEGNLLRREAEFTPSESVPQVILRSVDEPSGTLVADVTA